jgi:hypothetical protein
MGNEGRRTHRPNKRTTALVRIDDRPTKERELTANAGQRVYVCVCVCVRARARAPVRVLRECGGDRRWLPSDHPDGGCIERRRANGTRRLSRNVATN